MNVADIIFLVLLVLPIFVVAYVVSSKKESSVSFVNRWTDWISAKHSNRKASSKVWAKYVARPWLTVLNKLSEWTQRIQDPFWKAGVRFALWSYACIALAFIAITIAYVVIIIAIAIAVIALIAHILSEMGGQKTDEPVKNASFFGGDGSSRMKEGFWGDKYIETKDAEGNELGRSRERESFWGDRYIEHEDSEGNIVGRSSQKESFWGDKYTEHQDPDGNAVGKSQGRESFWGEKYVEHQNSDGESVGESRQREDFWGEKYTEHKSRKH